MEQDVCSFYQEEILRIEGEKEKLAKDYNRIAWSRLVVFLAAVILLYMGLTERPGKLIYLIGGIVGFAAFLFLIRMHDGIEKKQRLLAARETAVRAYPERFTDGWRDFPENGSKFLEIDNDYSHDVVKDLDLLGPGSLYQMISICQTAYGKWKLADTFLSPLFRTEELEKRQEAIKELADKKEFLLDYESVVRQALVDNRTHPLRIGNAESRPGRAYKAGKIRFAPWMGLMMILVPLINVAVIVGILAGLLQPAWILVSFLVGYGITAGCREKLDSMTASIFSSEMTKGRVYPIFETIRDEEFSSEMLRDIHNRVAGNDGMLHAQKRLSHLADLKNLDYNPILGMLMTGFLGWNFFMAYLACRWDRECGAAFSGSFDIIGDLEELGSLAVLSIVRHTTVPVLSEEERGIRFKNIIHPLIDPDRVVSNSGALESPMTIITGSNMSGKTTFLRTVAVNLVLSYIGAGVTADYFCSCRRMIFTSMRVHDDVAGGISTFYAEILRIKEMAEYIRKNNDVPALCLIDEIFKGTNSADRIVGSEEAIKKLSLNGSMVVVTTHDFELCSLKMNDGTPAENFHFEEYYEGDKLKFDYIMKDGPCTTRNARALLKMAGIMDEESDL